MNRIVPILALVLALSACTMNQKEKRAVVGGAIGAGVGAVLSGTTGALVGGLGGAAIGALTADGGKKRKR